MQLPALRAAADRQAVRRREEMASGVSESEWKVFRELREVALERFCKRVLDEVERVRSDALRSHHERYLDVYSLLQDRDEKLAQAFNDPRRSRMMWQLAAIHSLGLLEPGELARFTAETRQSLEALASKVVD
jgi:hypothetical protein